MNNQKESPAGRREWMEVMARAEELELEKVWDLVPDKPAYIVLRKPETGLVMVQARAGNTGRRFNLGEMTVTRCTVRIASGSTGHCYLAGRKGRQAELAAVLDAMLQEEIQRAELLALVIEPLKAWQAERRSRAARKVAPTKVDFFTMVRGD